MFRNIVKIRNHDYISVLYACFVILWGIIGIVLLIIRAMQNAYNVEGAFLITFFYFTSQSNILITVIALLFVLGKKNRRWFDRLSFIGLINIFVAAVVFHTFLIPYLDSVTFLNHVLHTINPILYFVLYFFLFNTSLKSKSFLISLIYPLVYVLLVYLIIEPFFGNLLDEVAPDFSGARYVYPFLDPRNYPRGVIGLVLFNFGLITPMIALISWGLLTIKLQLEKSIWT